MRLDRSTPPGALADPLSTAARRGILALVIFFHVGGGWALTQVEPVKLVVFYTGAAGGALTQAARP